ncbi:MAG TPA: hypothetical protein VKY82_01800 [Flavobacterium sp.]|nr:hypothetical protein [Flavobacterium sp.]
MDQKTQKNRNLEPDYVRIYKDLIKMKFPEFLDDFEELLQKEELNFFEITRINKILFGKKNRDQKSLEQKYKAYDKATILKMLRYQKKHGLNNTQLANHFKLSRNTVASWRRIFDSLV